MGKLSNQARCRTEGGRSAQGVRWATTALKVNIMQHVFSASVWHSAPSPRPRSPVEGQGAASRWRRLLGFVDLQRVLRFALVGGVAGLLQLALLALLLAAGAPGLPANLAAYLLSAQLNFLLSALFIWGDRAPRRLHVRGLAAEWVAFHVSIAGTALLNQAVFVLAALTLPDLVASAAGIAVAAGANFLIQDRVVFRRGRSATACSTLSQHGGSTMRSTSPTPLPLCPFTTSGTLGVATPHLPAAAAQPAARAHAAVVPAAEPQVLRLPRSGRRQQPALHHRAGRVRVDVVLPVYNEERVLADSVQVLHAFLSSHEEYDWRIIIADNASTDGTLSAGHELAAALPGVEVVHLDQKGRGRALRAVWSASNADVLTYMDIDLSTDLAAFPLLIAALVDEGYDLATGRRLGPGAKVIGRRRLREVTSRGYNLLIAAGFRPHITDVQCGFKAITKETARALLPQVEDPAWFFDTELLLRADKGGYRIKQIPVCWTDDPDSRVNVARTAWQDLKGLWRLKRAGV